MNKNKSWIAFLTTFIIAIILCIMPILISLTIINTIDYFSFQTNTEKCQTFFKENRFSQKELKNNYVFDVNNTIPDKKKVELNKKAEDIYKNKGVKAYFIYYNKDISKNKKYKKFIIHHLLEQQLSQNKPSILYMYDINNNTFQLYSLNISEHLLYDNPKNFSVMNHSKHRKTFYTKEGFLKDYENSLKHIEGLSNNYLEKEINRYQRSIKIILIGSFISIQAVIIAIFRTRKKPEERKTLKVLFSIFGFIFFLLFSFYLATY